MGSQREKAVVLLSGGLDSTTCLAVAQSEGLDVTALTFKYGQRHAVEVARATEIALGGGVPVARLRGLQADLSPEAFAEFRRLERSGNWAAALPHVVVEFDLRIFGSLSPLVSDESVPKDRAADGMGDDVAATYVPARNSVFLSFAAGLAETIGARRIFIGVNALDYSGYPDCREDFILKMQNALEAGTTFGEPGNGLSIVAPLVNLGKAEIIALGLGLGVDYGATHSCYDPSVTGLACGRCDSCVLRLKGFEEVGVADPALYVAAEDRHAAILQDAMAADARAIDGRR